ncbi:hypothetical protein ElyMa_003554100 [Elysia marginata]|uniref:Uncharacterized protein n=1 Tax=Elysia marginata TaxID=1093978 RepID=A0AAV4EKH5_9GAST|nr:hypothetical protein ElyMa_003554100 [Elysia marginata]
MTKCETQRTNLKTSTSETPYKRRGPVTNETAYFVITSRAQLPPTQKPQTSSQNFNKRGGTQKYTAISMVNAESRFVTEYDTSPLDAIPCGMFLGP